MLQYSLNIFNKNYTYLDVMPTSFLLCSGLEFKRKDTWSLQLSKECQLAARKLIIKSAPPNDLPLPSRSLAPTNPGNLDWGPEGREYGKRGKRKERVKGLLTRECREHSEASRYRYEHHVLEDTTNGRQQVTGTRRQRAEMG